jgi:hypothetical protein
MILVYDKSVVSHKRVKHALTQFLVLCNWGRAGLDGYCSGALSKLCIGTRVCWCVCIAHESL